MAAKRKHAAKCFFDTMETALTNRQAEIVQRTGAKFGIRWLSRMEAFRGTALS
jgi:hypothetical protein